MAEEKVTTMVLNVDLQCAKCYKLVKKLLCKFPEIRDQAFDMKANKVTIKVVSYSPETIRDKLYCKGCGCIKSIEIVKPPEPKPPAPKPPEPKPPEPKPVKVSVDLQVQGSFYCKGCGGKPSGPCSCGGKPSGPCSCGGQGQCVQCKWCIGWPSGPCSCGGQGQCVHCKWCSGRPCGPCSCGGQGQCIQCKWCIGWPSGPCSCGGQGQCDLCCGRPVWCRDVSVCEEAQPGCSIM